MLKGKTVLVTGSSSRRTACRWDAIRSGALARKIAALVDFGYQIRVEQRVLVHSVLCITARVA